MIVRHHHIPPATNSSSLPRISEDSSSTPPQQAQQDQGPFQTFHNERNEGSTSSLETVQNNVNPHTEIINNINEIIDYIKQNIKNLKIDFNNTTQIIKNIIKRTNNWIEQFHTLYDNSHAEINRTTTETLNPYIMRLVHYLIHINFTYIRCFSSSTPERKEQKLDNYNSITELANKLLSDASLNPDACVILQNQREQDIFTNIICTVLILLRHQHQQLSAAIQNNNMVEEHPTDLGGILRLCEKYEDIIESMYNPNFSPEVVDNTNHHADMSYTTRISQTFSKAGYKIRRKITRSNAWWHMCNLRDRLPTRFNHHNNPPGANNRTDMLNRDGINPHTNNF